MKKSFLRIFLSAVLFLMIGIAYGQQSSSVLSDPNAPQEPIYVKGGKNLTDAIPGYFYRFTDNNLYTFPVPAGAPQTVVGLTGNYGFYAGDFGPGGVYYAADAAPANALYSINPATRVATFLVPITGLNESGNITGMTYHEATNTMYLSTATSSSFLYTLNVNTGVATLIGPITNASLIIFIAINCEGELYGVEILNDVLVKINTSTAAGTVIGPTNYPANFAQGGDFDSQTGILYWAAYAGGGNGSLRTIDLLTGNTTQVVPLMMEVDAFVIQSTCKAVPLTGWAVVIGLILIGTVVVLRVRRTS